MEALRKMGLRERALLLMAAAFGTSALLAYAVMVPRVSRSFEEQVAARGEVMANILEQHQALRLAMSLHDQKDATTVAAQLLSGDKDLSWVILLDADDRVLGRATREGTADDAVAQAVAQHLSDLAKAPGQLGARGADADVQRFTRVVRRAEAAGSDDLAVFAGGPAPSERKALGTVLLGLSAREARNRLGTQALMTIGLTSGLIAVVFGVFFSRIAGRLRRMSQFAARVAQGDLAASISDPGNDEVGHLARSLEEMTRKTGGMVARLQAAAASLAQVSSELLQSSSQQGEAAMRQAASVAETGATVAELRETFNQASERAQSVIELARKSEESTTSGRDSVEESVAAMGQIRDQVANMSRTIQSLVERTAQIGAIIDAVNDLAEQSNVLALNAAIEAAKAGEHGRGFAVVAREVRSLAERSKDSTTQVRFILKDIEKATREVMGSIDEGTRKTSSGMELAHRAGVAIGLLDKAINDSSTAAKQIAASTRQQAVGVDQIWQAMRDIDRAVNESATGIRQIEDASRNMKSLSVQMAQLVATYTVARSGQGAEDGASGGA